MTVSCAPEADVLQPGDAAQGVPPSGTATTSARDFDTSTPAVAPAASSGDNRRQRSSMFRYSGCRSPQICFLHSDCHLRLPHPRCHGVRPRTHRLPSHPTEYVRGTLRTFRTRAVCLMCHRFHQDSSFVLPGKVEQPRRRGFYCRQC